MNPVDTMLYMLKALWPLFLVIIMILLWEPGTHWAQAPDNHNNKEDYIDAEYETRD